VLLAVFAPHFFVSASASASSGISHLTLGQLAQLAVAGHWTALWQELPGINGSAVPSSPWLTELRDLLDEARDTLDMFVFCYPTGTPDTWQLLRDDLNAGYHGLSHYADLLASNYSRYAQEQELSGLFNWRETFITNSELYNYSDYFSSPELLQLFFRSPSAYNELWWGKQQATSYYPSSMNTGIQNLAVLERAQLAHLQQRLPVLMSLPNASCKANADYMHQYKKQLRVLMRVVAAFPKTLDSSQPHYHGLLKDMAAAQAELTKEKKSLTSLLYYLQYGPPSALAQAQQVANKALQKVKDYIQKHGFAQTLQSFSNLIIQSNTR
jgi:hypothetical protein